MEQIKTEVCKICNSLFTVVKKSKAKYCSDECRKKGITGRPKESKKTTPGAKEIQRLNEWKKTNTISIKIPIYDAGLIIESLAYAAKSAEIIEEDIFKMGALAQFMQHMISQKMVEIKSS